MPVRRRRPEYPLGYLDSFFETSIYDGNIAVQGHGLELHSLDDDTGQEMLIKGLGYQFSVVIAVSESSVG